MAPTRPSSVFSRTVSAGTRLSSCSTTAMLAAVWRAGRVFGKCSRGKHQNSCGRNRLHAGYGFTVITPSLAFSTARGLFFFAVGNSMWARALSFVSQDGGVQIDEFACVRIGGIIPSSSPAACWPGAFGREHLSRLIERSDVKVVGVADTNVAAFEPIRASLGVAECLTDPLRLIDAVEADAIIVATPAVSHVEISVRALAETSLCCSRSPLRRQRDPPSHSLRPRAALRALLCPATCCGFRGTTSGWSKLCARGGSASSST